MRAEVMAAMFKAHERSQSGATHFWRDVSFGLEYFTDDNLPGAVLIAELSRALEDKDFREKEFGRPAIYYKKAIKAWNAFCAGQRISTLKVGKEKGWPEAAHYREETEAA